MLDQFILPGSSKKARHNNWSRCRDVQSYVPLPSFARDPSLTCFLVCGLCSLSKASSARWHQHANSSRWSKWINYFLEKWDLGSWYKSSTFTTWHGMTHQSMWLAPANKISDSDGSAGFSVKSTNHIQPYIARAVSFCIGFSRALLHGRDWKQYFELAVFAWLNWDCNSF